MEKMEKMGKKKIGILFSGYGSQYIGMGKEFYDQSRIMQELFEEAATCLEINFVKLFFASSDAEIKKIEHAYPAIFLYQISLVELLKEAGITACKVAGLDIGEYAAMYTVGGISMPDALYFLRKFASAYQPLIDQERFAQIRITGVSEEIVKRVCQEVSGELQKLQDTQVPEHNGEHVAIAVHELADQVIISGTQVAVQRVAGIIKKEQGIKSEKLDIERGLHSMHMDEVVKNIKMYLEKIDFKDTSIPCISSVIGQPLQEGELLRASVMQAIHAPVHWLKVMHEFSDCDVLIEIGASNQFGALFARVYPEKKVYTFATPADRALLRLELLGIVEQKTEHEYVCDTENKKNSTNHSNNHDENN